MLLASVLPLRFPLLISACGTETTRVVKRLKRSNGVLAFRGFGGFTSQPYYFTTWNAMRTESVRRKSFSITPDPEKFKAFVRAADRRDQY
jgi:hypothetical protein